MFYVLKIILSGGLKLVLGKSQTTITINVYNIFIIPEKE